MCCTDQVLEMMQATELVGVYGGSVGFFVRPENCTLQLSRLNLLR